MKFTHKMEFVLVSIIAVMCITLLLKLIYKLRLFLIWRVNCWFCNKNFWVKYPERNSWTCPKCEQYNGFTKDGDYNKPITGEQTLKTTPKVFQKSPPKNGLCKMCNINQQLKVAQLANFVPMNDKKFDEEIDNYKLQLEKAYKLCSPCKRVVQMKLHKEKESLLGSKLLETRILENKNQTKNSQNGTLKSFVNNTSVFIAFVLFLLVSIDIYKNIRKYENLTSTINNMNEILTSLVERIYSIVKMKTLQTFPMLEEYDIVNMINTDVKMPNIFKLKHRKIDEINTITQKSLGGLVCIVQIIGNTWNVNSLKYTIVCDLLWSVFVIMSIIDETVILDPLLISFIKITSVVTFIFISKNINKNKSAKKTENIQVTPKRMKNLMNGSINGLIDDDSTTMDTDDDVSLSKFGVHNFSESSSETLSPLNSTLMNGRAFTPRTESVWSKPKHNSTFCVNSMISKSPISVADTVFAKPTFNIYQKLAKDDSDSELDESISTLCIGSPNKSKKSNSVFSLRKFTASPNFVVPTPMTRARPLISPSKLSTSWVAGGYWGSEGEPMFSINGSRSSSQSSGFESQTSSMNQRNVFSQPSSREESICGEQTMDRFHHTNQMNGYQPQNFSHKSAPVFPQMQYNNHVHIPQSRFQQNPSQNGFRHQSQFANNNGLFKAPGGSGLIKLPQVNSFTSQ